jgi:glycosyltransferase involved in cell wall biosynthesis
VNSHCALFLLISRKLELFGGCNPFFGSSKLPWFICTYLPPIPGLKPFIDRSLWLYSRWLNKQCEAMIVPTSTIAQVILRHGGFKTQVISNGVDLYHFNPKTPNSNEEDLIRLKHNIEHKCPTILHVGRLDVDKNVDVVIKAAAIAIHKTDAHLLVVGDGECRKKLIKLANKLGIHNRCRFLGFVDPKTDLPGLYRMSSVFMTASEIETQGLVILEAMASGLPVVAVEATCIPEVIKHDLNGYLAPPGNVTALADYLVKILKNPTKGRQMGDISRVIVHTHLVDHSLDKHENIYRKIIHEAPLAKPTRNSWATQNYLS